MFLVAYKSHPFPAFDIQQGDHAITCATASGHGSAGWFRAVTTSIDTGV
jgi:hypothetical protein